MHMGRQQVLLNLNCSQTQTSSGKQKGLSMKESFIYTVFLNVDMCSVYVFSWLLGPEMGESIVSDAGWNSVPVTLSHAPSKRKTSGRNSVPALMGGTSTSMVYLQMSAGCQSIVEVRDLVQWMQMAQIQGKVHFLGFFQTMKDHSDHVC